MPRIVAQNLDSVVYLFRTQADADAGERQGGTGFLLGISLPEPLESYSHLYVVTNAHVARNAPVIRFNRKGGGTRTVPLDPDDWAYHRDGDDVAIWHMPHDFEASDLHLTTVPMPLLATPETFGSSGLGVGDECVMLGRLMGLDEREANRPVARFGNLARPGTVPVNGPHGLRQESFLVETRSLGGFSGSPVFLYRADNAAARMMRGAVIRIGAEPEIDFLVLGIDWAHLPRFSPVLDGERAPVVPEQYVAENSGFMAVVPAWKILDVLEDEGLVKAREQEIEAERAKIPRRVLKTRTQIHLDRVAVCGCCVTGGAPGP